MTNEQFDQLVNRIQSKYGSRPLALRMRIAMIVALGYSGFLAILILVVAIATALIVAALVSEEAPSVVLIAIVAVLLAFGLCQALVFLWVPMEPQKAREITRDEVPQFFELLDQLQTSLRTKRFDSVRITLDLNAGVQMIPRLGVFGFNRSYLYVGLPLMSILSPKQFSAVMAHEFAHSSSRHDRFGMWIYRLRQTWERIFIELRTNSTGGFVQQFRRFIVGFLEWYWPRFNAYAFVLSRANEYEADRLSAEWAGVEPAVEALFRLECLGNRMNDDFWNQVTLRARTDATVPDDLLDQLEAFLNGIPEPADATRWMEQSAKGLTGNVDTHPSLSDRLKALGSNVDRFINQPFPLLPSSSAANVFFANAQGTISRDVNLLWQQENTLRWQNVFHQARRTEKQLQEAVKAAPSATPDSEETNIDVDQLWKQVLLIGNLQGPKATEPLLRELLAQKPSHAQANVTLGRLLLERGHSEGELFLKRVLEEEGNELIPEACNGLIAYFQQLGRADQVRETRARLSQFELDKAAAAKERSAVTAKDSFIPHGLSDDERKAVNDRLNQESDLGSAWLVRKEMRFFPRQRLFLLVVQSNSKGLFGSTNPDRDRALVTHLMTDLKLPGRVLIVSPTGAFRSLSRKIKSLAYSKIYPIDTD